MSAEPEYSGEQNMEAAAPQIVESTENISEDVNSVVAEKEQHVPLSALQSERSKRQQMEEELQMIKSHVSLLQANQPKKSTEPQDVLGYMDDGDVMTKGDYKKSMQTLEKQYQMTIDELKMTQKHPDYQEVIKNYLPEVLKQNPGLRNSLQQTQDYELAYHLAKNSDNYRNTKTSVKKSSDAKRIVENSQKMGTLSSMGSASPISQAKKYKDMSSSEFRDLMNKHMG